MGLDTYLYIIVIIYTDGSRYQSHHFNLNLNTKFCIYDTHIDSQADILTVHEKIYPKKKPYYSKTKNDILFYTFYFFFV